MLNHCNSTITMSKKMLAAMHLRMALQAETYTQDEMWRRDIKASPKNGR